MDIREILQKYWGHASFRPGQQEVIDSVLQGMDTLALMPTGAGKSILYQVPGLAMEGVCIVITPLIALMKDQVDKLRRLGIAAAFIHSGLTPRQIDLILDGCCWGGTKFLYVAPERVAGSLFRARLPSMKVSLIAVDEAHCISQWGYDFRPSYMRIGELREIAPQARIIALTASATSAVCEDIMKRLGFIGRKLIRTSFARPNLSYAVRHTDDKHGQLLRIIGNVAGTGIVYVRTREQTEKLARFLCDNGIAAASYHGGMTYPDHSASQEKWVRGEIRVMVATNAFGMGIDKADVRFVVHFDICDSPEAYYQEAGRAGRDGRRSYCVLLSGSDDRSRANKRFASEFPTIEKIKQCYEALYNYLQIGIGDGKYASFEFNIHEFSTRAGMFTGTVFNCLKLLQQNGYLTLTDETDNPPRIMFVVGRDDLYKIRIERAELDHIIRTILRLYEGVFNERLVPVDIQELAHYSGYTEVKVKELLKILWRLRIIKYVPGSRSPLLFLNEERLPSADVYISPESYAIRKEMSQARLDAIFEYAALEERCRSRFFQEYFGDNEASDCGFCDVCLKRKKTDNSLDTNGLKEADRVRERIIEVLRAEPATVKCLMARFTCEVGKVLPVLEKMMEKGEVSFGEGGKIYLKD